MSHLDPHWSEHPEQTQRALLGIAKRLIQSLRLSASQREEDLVQDAWVELLRIQAAMGDLPRNDDGEASRSFVWAVMKTCLYRRVRQDRKMVLMDLDDRENIEAEENFDPVDHETRLSALQKISANLSVSRAGPERKDDRSRRTVNYPKDRSERMIRLIAQLGWSHSQIAEYLGCSINVLRNKLYLRSEITDDDLRRLEEAPSAKDRSWAEILRQVELQYGASPARARKILATALHVSPRTIHRWIAKGTGTAQRLQAIRWLAASMQDRLLPIR